MKRSFSCTHLCQCLMALIALCLFVGPVQATTDPTSGYTLNNVTWANSTNAATGTGTVSKNAGTNGVYDSFATSTNSAPYGYTIANFTPGGVTNKRRMMCFTSIATVVGTTNCKYGVELNEFGFFKAWV